MALHVRPAVAADAEACGRIMHAAFKGIADAHGFPPDFPSAEAGRRLAAALIASPAAFGVVAESDNGRVVGSNFLAEGTRSAPWGRSRSIRPPRAAAPGGA